MECRAGAAAGRVDAVRAHNPCAVCSERQIGRDRDGSDEMQVSGRRDVLALAEQEEADAVMRAHDADPLLFRPDSPLPPVPPTVAGHDSAGGSAS